MELIRCFGSAVWVGEPTNLRRYGVPSGGAFDHESFLRLHVPTALEVYGEVEIRASVRLTSSGNHMVNGNYWFGLNSWEPSTSIRIAGYPVYISETPWAARTQELSPTQIASELTLFWGQMPVQEFTVSPQSNRTGFRLVESLEMSLLESSSRPVCPGLIQLPPNGCPIILGPDGPTIGGYPTLAVLTQSSLNQLARMQPGSTIRFRHV